MKIFILAFLLVNAIPSSLFSQDKISRVRTQRAYILNENEIDKFDDVTKKIYLSSVTDFNEKGKVIKEIKFEKDNSIEPKTYRNYEYINDSLKITSSFNTENKIISRRTCGLIKNKYLNYKEEEFRYSGSRASQIHQFITYKKYDKFQRLNEYIKVKSSNGKSDTIKHENYRFITDSLEGKEIKFTLSNGGDTLFKEIKVWQDDGNLYKTEIKKFKKKEDGFTELSTDIYGGSRGEDFSTNYRTEQKNNNAIWYSHSKSNKLDSIRVKTINYSEIKFNNSIRKDEIIKLKGNEIQKSSFQKKGDEWILSTKIVSGWKKDNKESYKKTISYNKNIESKKSITLYEYEYY